MHWSNKCSGIKNTSISLLLRIVNVVIFILPLSLHISFVSVCVCLCMMLCKHTCFCVWEQAMNCLGEAVKCRSEMRARQFEVGNEWCPFSFECHRGLGLSDATSSYVSTWPLCFSFPLLCCCLSVHWRQRQLKDRDKTMAGHSGLKMKH